MFEQQQFDFLNSLNESKAAPVYYQVLRKKRKTLSLYVLSDQTVQVKAPLKMSGKVIDAFVLKHQAWIEKRKHELAKHAYMFHPVLEDGVMIPILGQQYTLKRIGAAKAFISIEQNQIIFACSSRIKINNQVKHFNKALIDFAKPIFEKHYQACLAYFQTHHSVTPPKLAIKPMKSQWGNYSTRQHRITLNLKLIHTEELCLHNVIFHELCHTKYHGHGKRFYKLLNQVMPNHKDAEKKLKHLE